MVRTHFAVDSAQSLEIIFHKIPQANGFQKVSLPSLDTTINTNGDISLLAHRTTEAPILILGSHMCQSIGQVVELAPIEQFLRHVVLQPQDLGNLHLN